LLAAALAAIAILGRPVLADEPPAVNVAAAANLERVLGDKLIPAFTAKTGIRVTADYGATGLLAKQMEQAAPFEMLVSADTATVDKLVAEKVLDGATEQPYAIGQLVVWSRSATAPVLRAVGDLANPAITHVAVANPKTAPYGAAAIETLTTAKLLTQVQPKIVYAENIQQALQFAVSGNADVAFTALSLVIGGKVGGRWFVVPASLHAPIVQSIALRANASAGAKAFEEFLLSKEAATVWKSNGYLLPATQVPIPR
jgi:molybdate transport system substrate-binding protein